MPTTFKTFDELFHAALQHDAGMEKPVNDGHHLIKRQKYELLFNAWLVANKGWDGEDQQQYTKLLTRQNWVEFRTQDSEAAQQKAAAHKREQDAEKQSWQLTTKPTLKVKQIALLHVYDGKPITRKNAGAIAAEYGFTATKSGEGLFQDFTFYSSATNRKGKPVTCTPTKLKNKIDLIESVTAYLSPAGKQWASKEISALKILYDKEYQ